MAASGHWRLIFLSTGEAPITSFTQGDGGTHARVLSLAEAPFGPSSKSTAQRIAGLLADAQANHGQAGAPWIQYLLDHQNEWPQWRERLAVWREKLSQQLGGDQSVVIRLAESLAVLMLTTELANQALDLGYDPQALQQAVAKDISRGAENSDRPKAAAVHIYHWAISC